MSVRLIIRLLYKSTIMFVLCGGKGELIAFDSCIGAYICTKNIFG